MEGRGLAPSPFAVGLQTGLLLSGGASKRQLLSPSLPAPSSLNPGPRLSKTQLY